MALLRGALKLNQLVRSSNGNQGLSLLLPDSGRHFSTQSDQPESQHSSSPIDSILQPPSTALVYGKLIGITRNTLKTDVINLFEGCKLTLDDIKVEYSRIFHPLAMLVQFPSISDFNTALRMLGRKGRLFKLDKVDRQVWDLTTPYNGRYVLLQGIPRSALIDDVEQILRGCSYDSSSLEMFTRPAQQEPIRMAKVRFPSQIEAMNAVIRTNGNFCLNTRIMARLLQ